MSDILANRIHLKVSKSRPYGRGDIVIWNGQQLDEVSACRVDLSSDDLNMVTLTFPAHVTVEEID